MKPRYSAERFSAKAIFLCPALYRCHDPLTFGNLLFNQFGAKTWWNYAGNVQRHRSEVAFLPNAV